MTAYELSASLYRVRWRVIFDKLVDCGGQSALDMTNTGILHFFLMEARSKEVVGEKTKGF